MSENPRIDENAEGGKSAILIAYEQPDREGSARNELRNTNYLICERIRLEGICCL